MKKISIDEVNPGQKIARTLYYQYGTVMLSAGRILTEKAITKLKEFGYTSLYVYDEDTADVQFYDLIDEQLRIKVTKKIIDTFNEIKQETQKMYEVSEMKKLSSESISKRLSSPLFSKYVLSVSLSNKFLNDMEDIVSSILSEKDVCISVTSLRTTSSLLYDHSLDTALYSILIARKFGFPKKDLTTLALGALLHDIGYLLIPEDIVNRTRKLSRDEEELLKYHTIYGYYLLREQGVNIISAHVAYQHHERQDGLGFPRCIKGTNKISLKEETSLEETFIHRYANIVAVANYYDNLISETSGKKNLPADVALNVLRDVSGTVLNEEAVSMFLSIIPVYPIGTNVVVQSDEYKGYIGVVIKVYPDNLDKPTIRLIAKGKKRLPEPIDIDLRVKDMVIKAVGN